MAVILTILENPGTDIDYMKQYRDFDMDPNTFSVAEGKVFLEKLHGGRFLVADTKFIANAHLRVENGQHYIPIVDSAIYRPNLANKTDAYATYDRGTDLKVFLQNPDGSEVSYIDAP